METEKFEYLTNAFHELKSPLTTITLATGIIKDRSLSEFDYDNYIVMIINECDRMKRLICNAIDSLRNNYFDIDINQKCNINKILERVVQSEKIEEIELILKAKRHYIIGNNDYIESAFRELIENSRKYRRECPLKLKINTYNQDNNIVIAFSDNGIGIEESVIGSVFDNACHFDYKSNNNQRDTGCGLFFLKRNIQRLNGDITVESKRGRGSKFSITLPIIV